MTAAEIIRAGLLQPARPWPRYAITSQAWRDMARALARRSELRFEALWADSANVYALFTRPDPLLVSAPVEAGVYGALSPYRPEAAPFERAIADLWGHIGAHAIDTRPWLDHACWPVLRPMQERPAPNTGSGEPPEMRSASGAATLQSGPIGAFGPALQAFSLRGDTILQVDARLGYAHRGVLALMTGRTPAEAAPLAARLSGEATVAYSVAFSRAAEAALGAEPPPRAIALRGVAAELERVAIHLHDLARMAEAAGMDTARLIDEREALLRACHLAFGHRLIMDFVIPGGVARDITPEGAGTLQAAVEGLAPPSLAGLARRTRDLEATIEALRTRLRALPEGVLLSAVPAGSGEGTGRADGARGEHFCWLRLRDGRVTQGFLRDPAWLLWPEFAAAVVGARFGELPLRAASFGLSVSGADL